MCKEIDESIARGLDTLDTKTDMRE